MPHKFDVMMHTRNCKNVHDYLNNDGFDMDQLLKMVVREFGRENVEETTVKLEKYFGIQITNLRQYFEALDARVAELK